jgi:hypothetical protein
MLSLKPLQPIFELAELGLGFAILFQGFDHRTIFRSPEARG